MLSTKFSIITPVYNGEKYIAKCIESVASLQYDLNLVEHIIVDDGSTDETKNLCNFYANKYKHIKFYSKQNGNWGSVINYVIDNKIATGDYILICDCDDLITPKAFLEANNKIDKLNFSPDLFVGSFYLWNGKKNKIYIPSYYFLLAKKLMKKSRMNYFSPLILPFSTYIKNEIFYQLPKLKEKISYQDSILFVNAFASSKSIGLTKKPLSKYWKTRPGNSMSATKSIKGIETQLINFQYFSDNDLIEPFIYGLMGLKEVKKYLKQNNIQFYFKTKNPDFSGFPWWARWMIKLIYLTQYKKFVK